MIIMYVRLEVSVQDDLLLYTYNYLLLYHLLDRINVKIKLNSPQNDLYDSVCRVTPVLLP